VGFAISGVRSVPPYSIDLREIRLDLHYNLFYNVYIISFSMVIFFALSSGAGVIL